MTVLVAAVVAALAGSDWVTDDSGRSYRVGFDPGDRFMVGAGWDYDVDAEVSRFVAETAWLVRSLDRDGGVAWKLEHEVGSVRLAIAGDVRFEGLLYRGEFLRWSKDGKITIPTSPPTRIGFPVDIGVTVELGRWRTRPDSAWSDEVGVVATELLFDFWRSPDLGSYFVLAIGGRYDAWFDRDGRATHIVAPFSAARLTLHHEFAQGKQLVELSADASTSWTSDETWADHAGASLTWEWIVLAINDAPLSLLVSGAWRWDELRALENDGHQVHVMTGLRLGL